MALSFASSLFVCVVSPLAKGEQEGPFYPVDDFFEVGSNMTQELDSSFLEFLTAASPPTGGLLLSLALCLCAFVSLFF